MGKYTVTQDFLQLGRDYNRPGTALAPQGLTIHETATPGATAANESAYFHNAYRSASAHFFVDSSYIIQIIPENEVAWHAGPTANTRFLSIEMCHFTDEERFAEVWARTVWLAADICNRYGFDPSNFDQLNTHAWVSEQWGETDHTDPTGYFSAHGKTWANFVNEVKYEMGALKVAESWKLKIIGDAKTAGLITEDHDPDETAPKWFILAVALNTLKVVKRA